MSFKDSGVEWIGEIPSHWGISKIKYQTDINKHTLKDQTPDDYIIQYIDIGNVNSEGQIQELQEYKFSDAPSRARRIVKKNDLLISTVRTYLKAITSILEDIEDNVICSTGFAVLTPKCTIDPLYLHYLSRSEVYIDEIVSRSTGVSYPAINASDIGALECILPPLDEQYLIGSFLHIKSSEVEAIIQSKLMYIKLLEQQRQSNITEAVTKGLNPNVKMKDSGIEWIGEIPEHWEINKIKFKFDIRKVIQPIENPTVLSLTQRGLKIKDLNDFSGQHAESYDKYQKVEINDYVMNGMDLLTGYVDCSPFEGVTSPDYRVFRKKDNSESHDYYLRYFQICYFAKIFYGHGQGVSNFGRWRLQTDVFKEFPIPVPSKEEQFEISEYLKIREIEIDKVLELIKLDIEKLKEYRQALIYEAATGKIDVRDMELIK